MVRHSFLAALLAIVGFLVAGCGSVQPSSAPGAQASASADQLYDAAKKEGEVVVNNQDPDSEKLAIDTFQKHYPGIKVTYQIGRGTDIARKLIDQAQGNVYTHDVFSAGPHDAATMLQAGMIEPYQSPELANVRPEFQDPNKILNPAYVLLYGFTVNTKLLPAGQEPK
ncbi:MAG TPA: extracellular solute-binding protein, partial [Chloroflexota bacterium]|nr:extracellular solute-binding protein [Chloroflexota bacterium]